MNFKSSKSMMWIVGLVLILVLAACGGEGAQEKNNSNNNANERSEENNSNNNVNEAGQDTPAKKIGVQIYDATDSEVVAFKRYYTDYIADNYNVEFLFSETIETAEAERTSAENFINQGVEAIISFSDQDRLAMIKMADEANVYYAVGAGTLEDEQFEEVKDYEYYIGSIGPSLVEEEEVGYEMAKYYIENGHKNYLLYTGGYPFVDMHKMRTDGIIRAFEEVGVTYNAQEDGQIGNFESDEYTINTIDGFPDDSGAFFGTAGELVNDQNLEVVITAALGLEFFGTPIAQSGADLKMGTVASFTEAYHDGFEADQVDYLAGKFASSIGPIFAAVYNAMNGDTDVIKNNGEAFRIDQGYWVATDKNQFNEMYQLSNSVEDPAYTKELLDTVIAEFNEDTDYENFESFVKNYSFNDIQAMLNE